MFRYNYIICFVDAVYPTDDVRDGHESKVSKPADDTMCGEN